MNKEYWITIIFAVHAKDEDEANEIAHSIVENARKSPWNIDGYDIDEIVEP